MDLSELFNEEEMHEPKKRRLQNSYNVFTETLNKEEFSEITDEINKSKITFDEAFLIFAYTSKNMMSDVSSWVNCAIRNNKYNPVLLEYIFHLQRTLSKLQSFTTKKLYRKDTYLDEDQLKKFLAAKGESFITPFFFSTSKEEFYFSPALCTTQFYIIPLYINSKGKDIERLSADSFSNEREVLFMKDTVFKITDVIIEKWQNRIYITEQVEPLFKKILN